MCKRLSRRMLDEEWAWARLVGEARLLRRLAGAGVPRWIADGEDEHGPWVVVERVPWTTLGARVGTGRWGADAGAGADPGAGADARWLAKAAASAFDALAALHGAGVVHGDLSPSNVLVSDDGARAVLVDLGLAMAAELPPMPTGPFRGTLAYAAPEVARGEAFGAAADLFALAASLLHVASGEAPRVQGAQAAMLLAAAEEPLTPWATRAARGLPAATAAALVACCAFDATARPATGAAVRDALALARDAAGGNVAP